MIDREDHDLLEFINDGGWVVLPSGVHIPSDTLVRQQAELPGVAAYVSLAQLRGRPATLGEIVRVLKRIDLTAAVQGLSRIALALHNDGMFNIELQVALTKALPLELQQPIMEILRTQSDRFVFFD